MPFSKKRLKASLINKEYQKLAGDKKLIDNCYVPKHDGTNAIFSYIVLHNSGIYICNKDQNELTHLKRFLGNIPDSHYHIVQSKDKLSDLINKYNNISINKFQINNIFNQLYLLSR